VSIVIRLRHIDLEILKGELSIEEIAEKVGSSVIRVKRHLSHLTNDTHQGMASHRLQIVTDVAVRFDLDVQSLKAMERGDRLSAVPKVDSVQKQWSDEEYKATVESYLWMLGQEKNGKPYNKSQVNQALRDGTLAARSKPSVEFRMRNISAVLEELCLPWIKGYLPAGNVRGDGKEKIKFYLASVGGYNPEDYFPTDDPEDFEQKVRTLREKIQTTSDPIGNKNPQQTSATITRFIRDPAVKASVLEKAVGICEGCGSPAPFYDPAGKPFLEVHHLKLLAEKGSDTIANAVALCPNCHRRCHHSSDKDVFIETIYQNVARLVLE